MQSRSVRALASAAGLLMTAAAAQALPVDVSYELRSLGQAGHYEFVYTFANTSAAEEIAGITIDFDPALYDEGSLQPTSVASAPWAESILYSVPGLPAQYDASVPAGQGLGAGQARGGFSVSFTWLGAGLPGPQPFSVYDPVSFDVLYTGTTVAVPEAATASLSLIGLALLAAVRRRRPRP